MKRLIGIAWAFAFAIACFLAAPAFGQQKTPPTQQPPGTQQPPALGQVLHSPPALNSLRPGQPKAWAR